MIWVYQHKLTSRVHLSPLRFLYLVWIGTFILIITQTLQLCPKTPNLRQVTRSFSLAVHDMHSSEQPGLHSTFYYVKGGYKNQINNLLYAQA